jgi:hypothetical protein
MAEKRLQAKAWLSTLSQGPLNLNSGQAKAYDNWIKKLGIIAILAGLVLISLT